VASGGTLDEGGALEFLRRFGVAIAAGDSEAIRQCFELPAMFLADGGVSVLADEEEMVRMFQQGRKFYLDLGLTETHPEVLQFTPLTARMYEARVRWPGSGSDGVERWSEESLYLLRLDNDGRPRIRVAATLGGREV
jgi:hypothetical protein